MVNENFIYSIMFAIAAFLFYKFHKFWLKGRDENPLFFKLDTKIDVIRNWIIIIAIFITSVVFLFKSF